MRVIKLSATILSISLFLMACNSNPPQQTATVQPTPNNGALADAAPTPDLNDYWARDNLDLQRVGNVLERSNSPQEFESYLNSPDGINNLDLNGDGYADYISVDEFQDRNDNERGLSLYSRFGPDLVQELAQIIFYRDDNRLPGARVLLNGNDQLYGDNYYYETNWLDRSLGIVNTLFGNRDAYYRSPYYYNNYPNNYQTYQVVETPYYRSRIDQLYPQPLFIYTTSPTFISKIKIKSPNNGLHMGQIKARLVKPTQEQAEFLKTYPGRPPFAKPDKQVKVDKIEKPEGEPKGEKKDEASKPDNQPKGDRKIESKQDQPGKPAQAEKPNVEKQNGKPAKPDQGGQGKGKGKGKP
jgi:hypothetical protein